MARIRGIFFILVGSVLLGGCFTSPEPLIGADQAVFPYDTIVFAEADRPDDRQTFQRKGDAYSFRPGGDDEQEALVRPMPAGDNLYVAQMEIPEDDKPRRLFALIKVDEKAMTAATYAAVMPDDFEDVAGLSKCGDVVCIDNLDAYVAFARAGIDAGRPPDIQYRIISLE